MRKIYSLVILVLSLNSTSLFAQSITCPGNITVFNISSPSLETVVYDVPTAFDEILGFQVPVPVTRVSGPASGSAFPLGTTTVTWQATIACGNPPFCTEEGILTCSFTVTVLPLIIYYRDNDGDGRGNPSLFVWWTAEAPLGYVSNNTDCNDNDINVWQTTTLYIDNDHDTYTNGTLSVCWGNTWPYGYLPGPIPQIVIPFGYSINPNGSDCDDTNGSNWRVGTFYVDQDKDGYDIGTSSVCYGASAPTGYSATTNGSDCDDNNAAISPGTVWNKDADNDLRSDGTTLTQCTRPTGYRLASELAATSGDCDDNAGLVWALVTFYIDKDHDGYDAGTTALCSGLMDPFSLFLAGLSLTTNGSDCDDDNAAVNPTTVWYKDADSDLRSDGTTLTQCTRPTGYRLASELAATSGDCNDNANLVWALVTLYTDKDHDGYDAGSTITCAGLLDPTSLFVSGLSLTTNGSDCNDNDENIYPGATELCDGKDNNCNGLIDESVTTTIWYLDADDDKYFVGPGVISCSSPGTGYKFTGLVGGDDCNDGDKTINPGAPELCDSKDNNCNGQTDEGGTTTTWYRDADTDGYGNPNVSTAACTQQPGYVSNSTDCDDNDWTVHENCITDTDHDGVADADDNCHAIINPDQTDTDNDGQGNACDTDDDNDGTPDANDCAPLDASISGSANFYRDTDGDGYGNPARSITACTRPTGYVGNNTDCNDNDKTIYPGAPELCDGKDNNCNGQKDEGGTTWYRDADGDGYGNPNLSKIACTRPAGYVSNNTDCNDNNKYIQAPVMYYIDSDRDGFGSQTKAPVCSLIPPSGYSLVGTDCNDNNATVNPLAKEICGNGTDDNCNGKIDEGCNTCQNATALTTTNITKSSAKLNWSASVNPVQWQVDYRKSGSSSWKSVSLSGSARSVTISSLSSNQTYNWRIKAKCGFSWTSYSATQALKTSSSSQVGSRELITKGMAEGAPTLKLYPNPSKGQFVVELHLEELINAHAKIQLIDVTGRTVQIENAAISYGSLQKAINVSPALAKGIYMVRIIVNDQVYKTQMIYEK